MDLDIHYFNSDESTVNRIFFKSIVYYKYTGNIKFGSRFRVNENVNVNCIISTVNFKRYNTKLFRKFRDFYGFSFAFIIPTETFVVGKRVPTIDYKEKFRMINFYFQDKFSVIEGDDILVSYIYLFYFADTIKYFYFEEKTKKIFAYAKTLNPKIKKLTEDFLTKTRPFSIVNFIDEETYNLSLKYCETRDPNIFKDGMIKEKMNLEDSFKENLFKEGFIPYDGFYSSLPSNYNSLMGSHPIHSSIPATVITNILKYLKPTGKEINKEKIEEFKNFILNIDTSKKEYLEYFSINALERFKTLSINSLLLAKGIREFERGEHLFTFLLSYIDSLELVDIGKLKLLESIVESKDFNSCVPGIFERLILKLLEIDETLFDKLYQTKDEKTENFLYRVRNKIKKTKTLIDFILYNYDVQNNTSQYLEDLSILHNLIFSVYGMVNYEMYGKLIGLIFNNESIKMLILSS